VDHSALELNHEQHIELVETERVHDEEVGGQDALGLGGEELLPGRSTARSWSETVASKDPADRARGDADPKPAKLALDATTSPAAVLPTEADDEIDNVIAERGTSRTSQGSPSLPLATESSRCQRSRVSGVTRKQRQRHLGRSRLSAARIARSVVR
jgi:hypothetical protein